MEEKVTVVMSRERPGRQSVPLKVVHNTDLIDGIMGKVKPIVERLEELEMQERLLKKELEPLHEWYKKLDCVDIEASDLLESVFDLLWEHGYIK